MNTFANSLYNQITKPSENTFCSPPSVQTAMGMVAVGTKGKTLSQLTELLGPQELFKKIVSTINSKKERPFELSMANALWGKNDVSFNVNFIQTVKEIFEATFDQLDYENEPQKAANIINDWCYKNTKGKIPTIIDESFITNDTALILTNAIYFKGKWEKQFNKKLTHDALFDNKNKTPMMNITTDLNYFENDQMQMVEIFYKGLTCSMSVFLPKVDLGKIESNLAELYQIAENKKMERKVNLFLPKFKIDSTYDLTNTLANMAPAAFNNGDFSNITKEKIYISKVIHKGFVQCDEEGTEAAASTAVGMRCTNMTLPLPPIVFNANHPFMFTIQNKGEILFVGHVVDPKS